MYVCVVCPYSFSVLVWASRCQCDPDRSIHIPSPTCRSNCGQSYWWHVRWFAWFHSPFVLTLCFFFCVIVVLDVLGHILQTASSPNVAGAAYVILPYSLGQFLGGTPNDYNAMIEITYNGNAVVNATNILGSIAEPSALYSFSVQVITVVCCCESSWLHSYCNCIARIRLPVFLSLIRTILSCSWYHHGSRC